MLEPYAVLKPWKRFTVRIAGRRRRRFVRVDMGRWWVSGKKLSFAEELPRKQKRAGTLH